jgi:hypothetical protein
MKNEKIRRLSFGFYRADARANCGLRACLAKEDAHLHFDLWQMTHMNM